MLPATDKAAPHSARQVMARLPRRVELRPQLPHRAGRGRSGKPARQRTRQATTPPRPDPALLVLLAALRAAAAAAAALFLGLLLLLDDLGREQRLELLAPASRAARLRGKRGRGAGRCCRVRRRARRAAEGGRPGAASGRAGEEARTPRERPAREAACARGMQVWRAGAKTLRPGGVSLAAAGLTSSSTLFSETMPSCSGGPSVVRIALLASSIPLNLNCATWSPAFS